MSATELGLLLSVFVACAVEGVEALTIVLAVGITRDWRSALAGAGAAVVALAAIVAVLGSAIGALPLDALRLAIGALLCAFGLWWLRKAVLRAAGLKAVHDERLAFEQQTAQALAAGSADGAFDPYGFAVCFKGVLLEGFEVALIVITFGGNAHRVGLASAAAGAALVVVVAAAIAAREPLARVPENALKFAVGVMLTSYGIFWVAEGAGVSWPAGDASLAPVIATVLAISLLAVFALRRLPVRTSA